MNFASDNTVGASAKILDALVAANKGATSAYGTDPYSIAAAARLSEVFEHETESFLVATGTAANALALGAFCPPWGGVFCHEGAHIIEDECGAPEMFTAGAKLVGLSGRAGKITPHALEAGLAAFPRGIVKQVQPAVLSLSQATEAGTLYTRTEIATLAELAHTAGLTVHMDGARFANALVAQNCTPAEMSWKAGIDVLSFGATKNGALTCEAVIFFEKAHASQFPFQRKRSGHTLSKGRLLGAQMLAYLEDGHWLDLARTANAHAARLADGLAKIPGLRLLWPREANEIFLVLPHAVDAALKAAGAQYYDWSLSDTDAKDAGLRPDEVLVRLIASFASEAADIERFLAVAAQAAASLPPAARPAVGQVP